jgi:hypothetical protein
MNDANSVNDGRTAFTRWLMFSILLWGLLIALGTLLFGGNQPVLRALIVAGCTLGFLGLWTGALAVKGRGSQR